MTFEEREYIREIVQETLRVAGVSAPKDDISIILATQGADALKKHLHNKLKEQTQRRKKCLITKK